MKKISEQIKIERRGLKRRKIPEDSYFIAHFHDGSNRDEVGTNWSDFSQETIVKFLDGVKRVMLSKHSIDKLQIFHGGLSTEVKVPKGCRVYQAIKNEVAFYPGGKKVYDRIIGRVVGIVNEKGEVIEERFLDGRTQEIFGYQKK